MLFILFIVLTTLKAMDFALLIGIVLGLINLYSFLVIGALFNTFSIATLRLIALYANYRRAGFSI